MKYIILIEMLLLGDLGHCQQVPNGNFEIWGLYNSWTLEPQDWDTPNNQLMTPVVQDLDAYEGGFAMKVTVLPGIEGAVQQIATVALPITAVPNALQFAMKSNIPNSDELDNVSVTVEFRLNGESVGTESLGIFESISTWQIQTINFESSSEAVDEVRIHVAAGYVYTLSGGSWETSISVDDMKFLPATPIREIMDNEVIFYPVPCDDELFIAGMEGTLGQAEISVFDSVGHLVLSEKMKSTLNLKYLNAGNYIVTVKMGAAIFCRKRIIVI